MSPGSTLTIATASCTRTVHRWRRRAQLSETVPIFLQQLSLYSFDIQNPLWHSRTVTCPLVYPSSMAAAAGPSILSGLAALFSPRVNDDCLTMPTIPADGQPQQMTRVSIPKWTIITHVVRVVVVGVQKMMASWGWYHDHPTEFGVALSLTSNSFECWFN